MLNITLASITAFAITFLAIPSIIRVSIIKNLFDEPGERKAHTSSIPTLGGLAIFAGVVFSYTFWSAGLDYTGTQYIIASIIVMFFIGIKDAFDSLSCCLRLSPSPFVSFINQFFFLLLYQTVLDKYFPVGSFKEITSNHSNEKSQPNS